MKRMLVAALLVLALASTSVHANAWTNWWSKSSTTTTKSTTNNGGLWWNVPSTPSTPSTPTTPSTQPLQPISPGTSQPTTPQPTNPQQPSGQPVSPSQPVSRNVPTPSRSLTAQERQVIDLVNKERRAQGLHELQVDMDLVQIAKTKSHDMASNNYFSHTSPTHGTVYNMLTKAGVSYIRAGENIARAASVDRAHQLFMNSSGHRVNIMSSGYTHIGVGVVEYGRSTYVTQVFIRR